MLICQHSLVLTPTVLIDDSLAGLFIDFVSLTAGLSYIFGCGFVTISQKDHRLVVGIRSFIVLVGRNADNLPS